MKFSWNFFVRNIFEICQHEVEKKEEKMSKSEASPFFIFFSSSIQNVAFRERGGTSLRNKVKSSDNMCVIISSKGVRGEVFLAKTS